MRESERARISVVPKHLTGIGNVLGLPRLIAFHFVDRVLGHNGLAVYEDRNGEHGLYRRFRDRDRFCIRTFFLRLRRCLPKAMGLSHQLMA